MTKYRNTNGVLKRAKQFNRREFLKGASLAVATGMLAPWAPPPSLARGRQQLLGTYTAAPLLPTPGDMVLRDKQTGTIWNLRGQAIQGPLAEQHAMLQPVPGATTFWGPFSQNFHKAKVWKNGRNETEPLTENPELTLIAAPLHGIPSLGEPRSPVEFVSPSDREATYVKDDDLVIGVYLNGQARAYPLRILWYHEIINDEIEGTKFTVTRCPLAGSSVVLEGSKHRFGVSGFLWNNTQVMYQHPRLAENGDLNPSAAPQLVPFELISALEEAQTGEELASAVEELGGFMSAKLSFWLQLGQQAVAMQWAGIFGFPGVPNQPIKLAGPHLGDPRPAQLPMYEMTWKKWKALYPETDVVSILTAGKYVREGTLPRSWLAQMLNEDENIEDILADDDALRDIVENRLYKFYPYVCPSPPEIAFPCEISPWGDGDYREVEGLFTPLEPPHNSMDLKYGTKTPCFFLEDSKANGEHEAQVWVSDEIKTRFGPGEGDYGTRAAINDKFNQQSIVVIYEEDAQFMFAFERPELEATLSFKAVSFNPDGVYDDDEENQDDD